MQRCFFFIFLSSLVVKSAFAQVDITQTELSFWVQKLPVSQIQAQAKLSLKATSHTEELVLQQNNCQIQWVRKQEGRLKNNLVFRIAGERVIITLDKAIGKDEKADIVFRFTINLDSLEEAYLFQDPKNLFLNPINLQEEQSLPGKVFYPTNNYDLSKIKVNLTLPKGLNSGNVGSLEFITDNGDGTVSHFSSSINQYYPHQFYLSIGSYDEFDKEDLSEELEITELNLDELNAKKVEARLNQLLTYLKQELNHIPNQIQLLKMDSLAEFSTPHYYLNYSDVQHSASREQFDYEKTYINNFVENNTNKASLLHFQYYSLINGATWRKNLITKRYEALKADSLIDELTLRLFINDWKSNVSDTLTKQFTDSLLVHRTLPWLTINYRYKEGNQILYVNQDILKAPLYKVPFNVKITTRDTTFTQKVVTQKSYRDTIKIPVDESPQAVAIDFGERFPAFVIDNRPDIYSLYDLSNAKTEEQRVEALKSLFKASNKNLVSTALGIAMDDTNVKIRLEALDNATDLNAPAQIKLKDTLIKLASSDDNAEVRGKAQKLVNKYFGNK